MPRYVILRHELPAESGRPSHWDFMLEDQAATGEVVLKTWAIERSPDGSTPQMTTRLPDHRAEYLEYEGPVSGGRGDVNRWDEGSFETDANGTPTELSGEALQLVVIGRRLHGTISLRRPAAAEADRFEYRYFAAPRGDA